MINNLNMVTIKIRIRTIHTVRVDYTIRPRGRPRQTCLRTVENDLKHQNLGLWSARHRAYNRELWREIVETATLLQGHAT